MRIDGMEAVNWVQDSPISAKDSQPVKEDTFAENKVVSQAASVENMQMPQATEQEKKDRTISDKAVQDAISRVNKAISGSNRQFEISIHQKTKQIMVKVIDTDTKEVIREIPPEKLLDMVAQMWEMAGILVDERR
jgi:flagellar protein FlaG